MLTGSEPGAHGANHATTEIVENIAFLHYSTRSQLEDEVNENAVNKTASQLTCSVKYLQQL